MKAEIDILKDQASFEARAVGLLAELLEHAVHTNGRAALALSGGSTPRPIYQELSARELPWGKIHLFFGDERCVPPDHKDSNYRMAREALIDPLTGRGVLPATNVHRVEAERPPAEAAERYEAELRRFFGEAPPAFDVALLGMGPDAHTASLFPHTKALGETKRWVVANRVEKLNAERITLTYPVLNQARVVMFLVRGADKAEALRRVLEERTPIEDAPAHGVRPAGRLIWLVDHDAASKLG